MDPVELTEELFKARDLAVAAEHVAAPALEQWYSHHNPGRRRPTSNAHRVGHFALIIVNRGLEYPALFDCGQVSGDTPNKRTWTQPITSA